jgi:hypothetical protein
MLPKGNISNKWYSLQINKEPKIKTRIFSEPQICYPHDTYNEQQQQQHSLFDSRRIDLEEPHAARGPRIEYHCTKQ